MTHELGPLPIAFWRRRKQMKNGGYCMVPAYTEDELRAYTRAEVARAVAAERERCATEIARQREVIAAVNSRCDHLGMRLGEVIKERDGLRVDAERYRWLRSWTRGIRSTDNYPAFQFPAVPIPNGLNIMQGSVAQHLDKVIDAAREST